MAAKIKSTDKDFILENLRSFFPKARILAFGSRIKGTSSKYADLDIAIDASAKIDRRILSKAQDFFSESQLPYKIDLTDYHRTDAEFRTIIDATSEDWTNEGSLGNSK